MGNKLKWFIVGFLIFLFNFYDGVVSCYLVFNNLAVEANPLVKYLMDSMGWYLLIPKTLVGLACWWASVRSRDNKVGRRMVLAITIIYGLLAVYHTYGLYRLFY
jgi:hypothetical protein